MKMKGSYKSSTMMFVCRFLVCDMKMKGSYKSRKVMPILYSLVCDMKMKGSYKVKSVDKNQRMYMTYKLENSNNRFCLYIATHKCS